MHTLITHVRRSFRARIDYHRKFSHEDGLLKSRVMMRYWTHRSRRDLSCRIRIEHVRP